MFAQIEIFNSSIDRSILRDEVVENRGLVGISKDRKVTLG
jgi:hypothetical protein